MMADGKQCSGGRMGMGRVPAHRGATKLVVLGCVAGAVCLVLRAAGDERDWSGVGQARRRLDAAMSERDQAERRLRAWRPEVAPHESPHSAGQAVAPAAPIATPTRTDTRTDTRVPPEPRTTLPSSTASPASRHGGRLAHDTVWWLAAAAHESGLRIGRLGPTPAEHGEHGAAGQRYDVAGTGGFGEVARWVRSLARVPATIVPLGIEVTRRAGGAVFSARFLVHDGDGRPAAAGGVMRAALSAAGAAEFGGSDALAMPRVAGILSDARGGLALIEAGGQARAAAVGERVGAERITRIAADGVWLEADDGREQRVALSAEASR
ncbi:hypothetical protein [Burkholderia plantarii]|uniref:hypothetical protein n=1 Tax=Burkholderia plantarii TaxID=41899 RepID=UPI0018DE52E9|nr:hypothetical protein [Burkholderia plantarii]MBI0326562.1 hypothetical protein [Burkholderia plantarii]